MRQNQEAIRKIASCDFSDSAKQVRGPKCPHLRRGGDENVRFSRRDDHPWSSRGYPEGFPDSLSVALLASIGPADGEAATQEFSIGAGSGKAQSFPPGALG